MTYTLMCAPSDQADLDMGSFVSIEAAQAALAAAQSEWDEQGGDKTAIECRWYVWDDEARRGVLTLHEPVKRRGRPPGTGLPPERRKDAMIRVRVTQAQADKFAALGGEQWLRERIEKARL